MNKVMNMNDGSLVKQVYHELKSLYKEGFDTWIATMHKLADDYEMNLSQDPAKFHHNCKSFVRKYHVQKWKHEHGRFRCHEVKF